MPRGFYFWENYIKSEKTFELKLNSYILTFAEVNQKSCNVYSECISFPRLMDVLEFIEYIIIPSSFISRIMGEREGFILLDCLDRESTFRICEQYSGRKYRKLVDSLDYFYSNIDRLKYDFSVRDLDNLLDEFNELFSYKNIVFARVNFYRNIQILGNTLIREYDDIDLINLLEEDLELNIDDIKRMFNDLDNNPLMLKNIKTYLNKKYLFI